MLKIQSCHTSSARQRSETVTIHFLVDSRDAVAVAVGKVLTFGSVDHLWLTFCVFESGLHEEAR